MKTFKGKIRNGAMVMCFTLVAALAFESSLEAQRRGSGGRSGGSSMKSRSNQRGSMNRSRGSSSRNRGSMNRSRSNRGSQNRTKSQSSNRNRNHGHQQTRGGHQSSQRNQAQRNRNHVQQRSQGNQRKLVQNNSKNKVQNVKNKVKGQTKNHIKNHVKNHIKNNHRNHHSGHRQNNGNHFSTKNKNRHHNHNWRHRHNQFHNHVNWNNHQWRYNHCRRVRTNRSLCWSYTKWCGYYPSRCHWWYSYCGSNYYFDPSFSSVCTWTYYPAYVNGVVTTQYQWHLGLDCVYIPGLGYGIQEVVAGSPAELAGLSQGMIIVSANGSKLETESAMTQLMNSSDGFLALDVVADSGGDQLAFDIQMTKVAVQN